MDLKQQASRLAGEEASRRRAGGRHSCPSKNWVVSLKSAPAPLREVSSEAHNLICGFFIMKVDEKIEKIEKE